MGLGLIIMYIGYAIIYWGVNAIQGKRQDTFVTYILPFGK
jgi:hypothetical protein